MAILGVAASEKRDLKRTNKRRSHDDCVPASIRNNWLGQLLLQHLGVAAGCCFSVLLYCGDEGAPPEQGYSPERSGIS